MSFLPESIRLNIKSDPATLAETRKAEESICAQHGFDDAACGEIGLCVNEALANVIRHAYDGRTDRPIEVRAICDDRELRVMIRDWGNGVDPTTLPPKPHQLDPGISRHPARAISSS